MKKYIIFLIGLMLINSPFILVESNEIHQKGKVDYGENQIIDYYINATDIPTWSIGDSWEYTADIYSDTDNGTFDLSSQDLTILVNSIETYQKDNTTYDAYHLLISGTVTGTFQASILSGDVTGVIDGEAYIRRADLSILFSNISSYGIISILILNYDYEIKNINEYIIPLEYFDFPIVPDEQWNISTHTNLHSSMYVEDFIDDTSSDTLISNESVHCIEKISLSTPIGSFETYHLFSENNGTIELWYAEDIKSIAKAVIIKNEGGDTNTIYLNISQYTILSNQIVINQTISPHPSPILDLAVIQGSVYDMNTQNPVTNTIVNITIPTYNIKQDTFTDTTGMYSLEIFIDSFKDNTRTSYDVGSDGIITTVSSFPQTTKVSTLIAVDNFSQVCSLHQGWNFISFPLNYSIHPENLFFYYDSSYLNWSDATSSQNPMGYPIINRYLFEWNRISQSYGFVTLLRPGYGYWVYAAEECVLSLNQECCESSSSITLLEINWNAIGLPQNVKINKYDMILVINGTSYSWNEAISLSYVNDFIFYWDSSIQTYGFATMIEPGYAFWLYSAQHGFLVH